MFRELSQSKFHRTGVTCKKSTTLAKKLRQPHGAKVHVATYATSHGQFNLFDQSHILPTDPGQKNWDNRAPRGTGACSLEHARACSLACVAVSIFLARVVVGWHKTELKTPHLCACAVVITLETQKCRKKAPSSVEFNFFMNRNRRKRFLQNERRRANLQNLASKFLNFCLGT